MLSRTALALVLCLSLLSIFSCGDETFLQPARKETAEYRLKGISEGQVLAPGDAVALEISSTSSQKNKDLELEVSVYSSSGEKLWSTRMTTPVLNEPLPPLELPRLDEGQYRMELTLYSAGEEIQRTSAVFFASDAKCLIKGIKSFPAVIETSSAVLLKAEIEAPEGTDPYLRWRWRGKTLAGGKAGEGMTQYLWTAPNEEGVYTITLELFPIAPVENAQAELHSSLAMSTDVYVSSKKGTGSGELALEGCYFALYRMQGNLRDSAPAEKTGAKKEASLIGPAQLVPTDRGFGYRVSGGAGISIPRFVLPVERGTLAPFTLSIGLTVEPAPGENRLVDIESSDGVSFVVTLAPGTLSPLLTVTRPGGAVMKAASRAELKKDQRHLLSITFVPAPGGFSVQWFVDGEQTNAAAFHAPLPGHGEEGNCTIAGKNGFTGTVDGLAVYWKNADGKPSSDPDLYGRAARAKYAEAVVLAEGFDSASTPEGFTLEGGGSIKAGALTLPAGAGIRLPPMTAADGGIAASFFLEAESAQNAALFLNWPGRKNESRKIPLQARAGELRFSLGADRLSFMEAGGQTRTMKLAVSSAGAIPEVLLECPAGSKPLVVKQILVLQER